MSDNFWGFASVAIPPLLLGSGYLIAPRIRASHGNLDKSIEELKKLKEMADNDPSEQLKESINNLEILVHQQTDILSKPRRSLSLKWHEWFLLVGMLAIVSLLILGAFNNVIPWDFFIYLCTIYLVLAMAIGLTVGFFGDKIDNRFIPERLKERSALHEKRIEYIDIASRSRHTLFNFILATAPRRWWHKRLKRSLEQRIQDLQKRQNPGEQNPGEQNPGEQNPGEQNPGEQA